MALKASGMAQMEGRCRATGNFRLRKFSATDGRKALGRTKKRKTSSRRDGKVGACTCPDCRLPPDGPPAWLRDKAVPVWTGDRFTELEEDLGEDAAAECATAFAHGFEHGLITAMLRPEWAQAFYLKLRAYYLLTHTEGDLGAWEELAEKTCQAIPLESLHGTTERTRRGSQD
jgi:hypothetical protein